MGGGGGGGVADSTPLLKDLPNRSNEAKGHTPRTGTLWTASAHIITAVIGSGVLSLGWSMAQLGWVAGPAGMLMFATITMIQSSLLADCYRSPDPEHGHIRNHSFMDAVKLNLGERNFWFCGLIQQMSLYSTGIAYTMTSAISMREQSMEWLMGM